MIIVDGKFGEGGGQIVRTALCLAALTATPITIQHIRSKRPKPGLWAQHLTACTAVNAITGGDMYGATLGSAELSFVPKAIRAGDYEFDIGTAGAVTLVAQTILPLLLLAKEPSQVHIHGGTHVFKSPGFDYFKQVFLKAIARFGAGVNVKLVKAGYYPKGGGEIELRIHPSQLKGVKQWPTETKTHAIIRLAHLPNHIAEREQKVLQANDINDVVICRDDAVSPGNSVTLWRGFCGAYAVGERGKPAEQVAEEAIQGLAKENAEVDRHLADQLLIYAILATGATAFSTSELTQHFMTHSHIIQQFYSRSIRLDGLRVDVE